MGMDLLLNFVWADKDKEPDWDGARKYIEDLSATDLQNHPEFEFHQWTASVSDREDIAALEAGASLRNHLLECHDAIKGAWNGDGDWAFDRQTYYLNIGKYKVLVSGGDSYGDSPSPMFNYIQDWGNVEGLPKFGFYNE